MKRIIPAIIASSQKELETKLNKVKNLSPWIQLDVMDGLFVKNRSLDFDFKLPKLKCKREAHLMIKNPETWIKKNAEKVNTIIIHYESTKNLNKAITLIKKKKKKVGIAINPETSINKIKKYVKNINLVLIMTVHPGKYGSAFLPKTLLKVKQLRKMQPKLEIEIDGGINPITAKKARDAGANRFAIGSYFMHARNAKKAMNTLKRGLS